MSIDEALISSSSNVSSHGSRYTNDDNNYSHHADQSSQGRHRKFLTPFVAGCYTLNYIMGFGFLTLPWAFVQSGVILSSIMMLLFFVFSDFAKDYILEGMARAEAFVVVLDDDGVESLMHGEKDDTGKCSSNGSTAPTATVSGESDDDDGHDRNSRQSSEQMIHDPIYRRRSSSLLSNVPEDDHPPIILDNIESIARPSSILIVKDRLFEVNELCRIFNKTPYAFHAYNLAMSFTNYLALWAFTTVFASALSEKISIAIDDDVDYYIFTLVFSIIVVPLSCLELREQIVLQVCLSFCRAVMALLMVSTLLPPSDDASSPSPADDNFEPGFDGAVACDLFHFPGLAKTLPIIALAIAFHVAIPGLSHDVSDKRQLATIFRSTLLFCFVCYAAIAITVAWYFGDEVEKSANLNWMDYRGGTGEYVAESEEWVNVSWWARAISVYVVCFPALDAISAFPLSAIVLGNNLFKAYYGSAVYNIEGYQKKRTQFRLLASVPPIIGALFVNDLGVIADLAGAVGLTLIFTFPAFIYMSSQRRLCDEGIPYKTCYKGLGSNNLMASFLFLLGMGLMIYYLVYIIVDAIK